MSAAEDRDALAEALDEVYFGPSRAETERAIADAILASDWLAEHDRQVAERHRHEWADYLSSWSGAVGPKPPTIEGIIGALRADTLPFGCYRADRIAGES